MSTVAAKLPEDVRCVGASPSYTQDTLPAAFHPLRPAPGEWWVVQVDHGRIGISWNGGREVAGPGRPVVVPPLSRIHLQPDGPVRLRFVRHRRPGEGHPAHLTQR